MAKDDDVHYGMLMDIGFLRIFLGIVDLKPLISGSLSYFLI
ncbi:hypothetical protein [Methanobacterium petrolearium]|nr:hypothetical protein [Methanobacterium petrolearium]